MDEPDKKLKITPGKVAYDAYCAHRDWKSVKGDPLPTFDNQSEDVIKAWEVAACAVLEAGTKRVLVGLSDKMNSMIGAYKEANAIIQAAIK